MPPGETNHGPRPDFPRDLTIIDLLRQHAAATPDAPALVLPEGERRDGVRREVTYAEMWAHVRQIASALVRAGARRGSRWVMVVLPEGLAQVCAVWGVMAAGCGYVPIDAETQASRLRTLVQETDPSAIIGDVVAHLSARSAMFMARVGRVAPPIGVSRQAISEAHPHFCWPICYI